MEAFEISNAHVWTHDLDGSVRFEKRSITFLDGRIAESQPASAGLGASGRFVCPGFVDAHFHLIALANKSLRVDLGGASSAADVVARLARRNPSDAPVGVDFDESEWTEPALPTRTDLNAISATTPVYARRVCCHVGVANDALLDLLASRGLERFVDRDSGRITEDAVFEANRLTRPPDAAVAAAMETAVKQLHALGITKIHDIVDPDTIDVYVVGLKCLQQRPLRIDAYLHTGARDFAAARARLERADASLVRAVGIKIFSDGSLGARTAALHAPYADAETRGELLIEASELAAEITACAEQGIECAVHAIGDRAMSAVLDAIEAAGSAGKRVRIEHAEIIAERDIERIVRLGVPLVMQPNFVRNWGGEGGLYERRLGRERWQRNNPFATLLRAGARVVLSSDGMPAGPLFGLKGATYHAIENERIGAIDAVTRYTIAERTLWGAEPKPALAVGDPADVVILSGNPLLADLDGLRVINTFAAGVNVFEEAPPLWRKHLKKTP